MNEEQAPMVYPGKEKRGQLKASDYVLAAAGMRVTARYSGAADDLRLADEWLAHARTKLPSTRTEIGAGGELIDRENRCDPIVDTVAHPDYVTAEASRDRLGLANEAGSLGLAREPIKRVQARLEALVMSNAAPRCGARSKRTGKPCRAAAMPNGRCKLHGGKSTGPRTPEGLERSKMSVMNSRRFN